MSAAISDAVIEGDRCVTLRGIGWGGFCRVLRARGDRSRPRMIYLDGDLILMSPGHSHERDKERFGKFVTILVEELDIPCIMAGSTTYRRRKKDAAVEPDQSYYLENVPLVRDKKNINLRIDPPPDLSIEVVYSNSADAAVEVSRRLKVPEVWVCDESGLKFLVRNRRGRYAESPTSRAFPFLTAEEIVGWIRRPDAKGSDTDWIKALRRWVRETIIPRIANRTE